MNVKGGRPLAWLWQFLGNISGANQKDYSISDVVSPTIDVEANWPLDLRIEPDTGFATNAAAITTRTYGPSAGKHRLYLNMQMAMTNRTVNDVATLFVARPGATAIQTLNTIDCFTTKPLPLIGCNTGYDPAGALPFIQGVRPVYVAAPNSLVLSINRVAGVNGTTDVQLSFIELDLSSPIPRFLFSS